MRWLHKATIVDKRKSKDSIISVKKEPRSLDYFLSNCGGRFGTNDYMSEFLLSVFQKKRVRTNIISGKDERSEFYLIECENDIGKDYFTFPKHTIDDYFYIDKEIKKDFNI